MPLGDGGEETQQKIDIALLRQEIRFVGEDVKGIKAQMAIVTVLQSEVAQVKALIAERDMRNLGSGNHIAGWSSWIVIILGLTVGLASLFFSLMTAAR